MINDFSKAQNDHIDLHNIDANAGLVGNQAFKFIGAGAFTKTAGELHFGFSGGDTLFSGDVNGDGAADFAVLLKGQFAMAAADFIL